jgi:hypothetical protein
MISPYGVFVSYQVNVGANGQNIVGDAANEPSIAVDPTDNNKMTIGWRQFDSVQSNFRQGGWGFTSDGGFNWTFPGVLEPGVFRSDPVLYSNETTFTAQRTAANHGRNCNPTALQVEATNSGSRLIGPTAPVTDSNTKFGRPASVAAALEISAGPLMQALPGRTRSLCLTPPDMEHSTSPATATFLLGLAMAAAAFGVFAPVMHRTPV